MLRKDVGGRNLMSCVPSLADLSKLLLKRVLRKDGAPHDCKEDAIAAVQLAKHLMQHGPTLVLDPPNVKVHLQEIFSSKHICTCTIPAKGHVCLNTCRGTHCWGGTPGFPADCLEGCLLAAHFISAFVEELKHIVQALQYAHVSAGSQGAAVQAAGAFSAARCGRG